MAGILYLVATPIGNLEDITFRAVRILRECDLIACEDTRQTRKLLDRYGIAKPVVSYHEHNEAARAQEIAGKLLAGESVALVSDAGTPLVADPGYRLVRAALDQGLVVVAVPGPSAAVTALAASGLPTDTFRFGGFLPAKAGQRARLLESLRDDAATLVFYEAPHRILETLADVARLMPGRPVVVARELTKIHEEYLRGTAEEIRGILAARPAVKGEITLLIGKSEAPPAEGTSIEEAVAAAVATGLTRMEAIKAVARRRGLSKRDVYRRIPSTTRP
ncbi:MAG: 16S rRNA (cytidine(1402)-2'-O)-methyltransferase [Candidatus Solibacter usitatus]|nr:16S rRNA (cytidine(1402)-2'-O)-methyltransferase [Candidatus Solibacter usitatus]